MHFFKNSVSFIAVMCVCGAALAATTGRVGVVTSATSSRRLPSLSNIKTATSTTTTTTSTTSSTTSSTGSATLSDTECIDEYRDCMKSDTACGSDFAECTTNVLFHGHMAECFSTLYQCSPTAIQQLMGTNNLSALSNVDSYVDGTNNTEVARYTYPTDGSVMGMDIIGASTRNKLSTADCVKKYQRCLTKDNVCGEDFELCTSDSEFKKQAAMCDSTLSRCQKEGFQQLFGEAKTTKPVGRNFKSDADGTISQWIADGAALAAANAVNTCYKVVDNCFANACAKNPYSCVEDVDWSVVNAAQSIVEPGIDTSDMNRTGKQLATDVRKFFRAACTDTIGANQYCFMTFNDGKKPTKADLQDEDLRDDVFGDAYASRKTILTTKVNELVKKFDTTAREKCVETFKTCAVRSCGGGSGAACYSRVFGDTNREKSINTTLNGVYADIKAGCESAVNTDPNCRHMAAMQGADTYTFEMGGTTDSFGILFPAYDASNTNAPIVAALNADLSTAYNSVAIEQMKKSCQNLVANCVKSMCGKDYQNCYRNRSDISVAVYDSGNAAFDKSMNKVGGVLDYTIMQGLCASTVKSADACSESLAIAKMGLRSNASDVSTGWGTATSSTLGNAWSNSAKSVKMTATTDSVQEVDESGRKICDCTNGGTGVCADESGGNLNCTTAHMTTQSYLVEKQAVNTVFQEVLADVEAEAQAQYKAKLTKEQNVCLAQNTGANPNATFVWAKLKSTSGKIPANYSSHGLGENTSVPSNDLYNSFCRVKVSVMSEDKDIQSALGGESYAYFSAGDAFTCGSWISDATLKTVTDKVGEKARKEAGEGSQSDYNTKLFTTLGVGALGGGLTAFAYDKLQTSDGLGGLLNKNLNKSETGDKCADAARDARKKYDEAIRTKDQRKMDEAVRAANQAKSKLKSVDSDAASKITIPSSVNLESYDTDVLERAAEDAVLAQDAEYTLKPNGITAVSDVIGRVEAMCHNDWAAKNPKNSKGCDDAVKNAKEKLQSIVSAKYTGVGTVDVSGIKSDLNTAISNLKDYHREGATEGSKAYYSATASNAKQVDKEYKLKVDELIEYVSNLSAMKVEKTKDAVAAKEAVKAVYKQAQRFNEADQKALDKAFADIEDACETVSTDSKNDGQKTRIIGDAVAGAAGALVTGFAANRIVANVQEAKYENAANEAIKKWMDEIGSKIHCYVGGELTGSYGDIVTITITED